jgi:hypothetical protein
MRKWLIPSEMPIWWFFISSWLLGFPIGIGIGLAIGHFGLR